MMRRAETIVVGVALFFLMLGLTVMLLQGAWFTHALSSRFSVAERAGFSASEEAELAQLVRGFVVDGAGELPVDASQVRGFDAAAIQHLADVQRVLAGARFAVGLLVIAVATWTGLRWRSRPDLVIGALRAAGAFLLAFPVLAGAFALIDPLAIFSAFHALFFAEGTWTFSYDSLLIRLFPGEFWAVAGATWGALVVAAGACSLVAARQIGRVRKDVRTIVRDKHAD